MYYLKYFSIDLEKSYENNEKPDKNQRNMILMTFNRESAYILCCNPSIYTAGWN